MATNNHYDVIIIGSGAGGGTLAHKLAPTGKKILILERGGYVPREKDNWNAKANIKPRKSGMTKTATSYTRIPTITSAVTRNSSAPRCFV
jgi:choline dehydrogenase-like flavoprotein